MLTPSSKLDRLRHTARELVDQGGDVGELGQALLAVLVGEIETFEAALDLQPDWRRTFAVERRAERDAALRTLAQMLLPDGSLAEREVLIRAELRRYGARWQRRDRHLSAMPADYAGRLEEHLYQVFAITARLAAEVPLGRTQLRSILAIHCADEGILSLPTPIAGDTSAA